MVHAVLDRVLCKSVRRAVLDGLAIDGIPRIAGVDKRIQTLALARERLHELLVHGEGLAHLVVAHVVEEDALAHGADGDGGAEFAVARLEDGGGGLLEQRAIELRVVHGEAGAGEEGQDAAVVGVGEEAADVGEGG